jgi:hypothetical protein
MIPLIGYMIGAYILVRMLEIILNKDTQGALAISAFIASAVVCLCLIGLFFNGYKDMAENLDIPSMPHNLEIPHSK